MYLASVSSGISVAPPENALSDEPCSGTCPQRQAIHLQAEVRATFSTAITRSKIIRIARSWSARKWFNEESQFHCNSDPPVVCMKDEGVSCTAIRGLQGNCPQNYSGFDGTA